VLGSSAPHLGNSSGTAAASTCSWLDPALGPWGKLHGGFTQRFPELCPGLQKTRYPMCGPALPGWGGATGRKGKQKVLGSFQSAHTAKHKVLGSIPGWGPSCSTVNAGHRNRRATAVSEGSTELCTVSLQMLGCPLHPLGSGACRRH